MTTRRIFLQSVPLMAATTVLPSKAAEQDSPEYFLGRLVQAMKARHGGDGEWKADINHTMKTAIVFKA